MTALGSFAWGAKAGTEGHPLLEKKCGAEQKRTRGLGIRRVRVSVGPWSDRQEPCAALKAGNASGGVQTTLSLL